MNYALPVLFDLSPLTIRFRPHSFICLFNSNDKRSFAFDKPTTGNEKWQTGNDLFVTGNHLLEPVNQK